MVGGPLAGRELLRQARRWQSWVLRFAVSAVAFAAVLWLMIDVTAGPVDVALQARLGRSVFLTWATLQLGVVTLLAPLLAANVVREESQGRTLELLALTPLSLHHVFAAKVGAVLAMLVLAVLGGVPIVAVSLGMGGVGVWEIVNAAANTVMVALLLGAVGALAAVRGPGGVMALLAAVLFGAVVLLGIPLLSLVTQLAGHSIGHTLSPLLALDAGGPSGLLPPLALTPLLASVLVYGRAVSDLAIGEGGIDDALPVAGVGAARELERVAWMTGFGATTVLPLVFAAACMPLWAFLVAVWLWCAVSMWAGGVVTLAAVLRFAHGVGAQDGQTSMAHRQFGAAGTWASFRRTVWRNPVAWREFVTRAHDLVDAAPQGGLLFATGLATAGLLCRRPGPFVLHAGLVLLVVAGLLTVGIATASMLEERRAGTLPLVLISPLGAAGVVRGKALAALVQVGPFLLLGAAMLGVSVVFETAMARVAIQATPQLVDDVCGAAPVVNSPLPKLVWSAAWVCTTWAALLLISMLIAARVRPARVAWTLNLGGAAALLIAAPVTSATWGAVLAPLAARSWPVLLCGPSPGLVWSVALGGAAAAVAGAVLVKRLPAWAMAAPGPLG